MALTSLQNQFISASYGQLVQVSGSAVADGDGNLLDSVVLEISASNSISASYSDQSGVAQQATSASHALNADDAITASLAITALTATTASYATNAGTSISASYALTASHALNVPATASYAISSSHALNADEAISSSYALNATSASFAAFATSASHALASDTSISASHALVADSVISASYADSALSASHALIADHSTTTQEVIINVKNTSGSPIAKGTPVYATGVTGENINVSPADYASPTTMPAIAVTQVALSTNSVGEATVTGRIIGVNTTGFTAGRNIYVNGNGTFTDTRPTGSGVLVQNIGVVGKVDATDGEIVIQGSGRTNDLPNILEGYAWVGNADGVATATATSSLSVKSAETASFMPSDTNLSINSISASSATFTSASIGFLESITGSAKIIGDAFIILNNDLPTERFAGIVVQDSGSGAPLTTASFQFDGQTNDWFYEYSDDGGTTNDHGVALFGPEYTTRGVPTYPTSNKILKGNGDNHILDSTITDTGAKVSTTVPFEATQITASVGFNGNLTGQASTAISASHALVADTATTATSATTAVSSSHALNADNAISASHALNADNAISASHALASDTSISASHAIASDTSISASHALAADTAISSSHALNADYAISASKAITLGDSATIQDISIDGYVTNQVNTVSLASNTASLDLQNGNTFYIDLSGGAGSGFRIEASSAPRAGAVYNIVIKNGSSGTTTLESYSADFLFSDGTEPTLSDAANEIQLLSGMCVDGTNVLMTGLANFS